MWFHGARVLRVRTMHLGTTEVVVFPGTRETHQKEPNSDGLQPNRNGLQPRSDGHQPHQRMICHGFAPGLLGESQEERELSRGTDQCFPGLYHISFGRCCRVLSGEW